MNGNVFSEKRLLFSVSVVILLIAVLASVAYGKEIETINVGVLSSRIIVFNLNEGVIFNGSLRIRGGNDIDFYVTDPQGNRIVNLNRVSQTGEFEFTARESGTFILHFDNSFSWLNAKTVTLSYDIEGQTPPTPIKPKNAIISIPTEAVIMVSLALIGIGIALLLRHRRKNPSIEKSNKMPTEQDIGR